MQDQLLDTARLSKQREHPVTALPASPPPASSSTAGRLLPVAAATAVAATATTPTAADIPYAGGFEGDADADLWWPSSGHGPISTIGMAPPNGGGNDPGLALPDPIFPFKLPDRWTVLLSEMATFYTTTPIIIYGTKMGTISLPAVQVPGLLFPVISPACLARLGIHTTIKLPPQLFPPIAIRELGMVSVDAWVCLQVSSGGLMSTTNLYVSTENRPDFDQFILVGDFGVMGYSGKLPARLLSTFMSFLTGR